MYIKQASVVAKTSQNGFINPFLGRNSQQNFYPSITENIILRYMQWLVMPQSTRYVNKDWRVSLENVLDKLF
jgi:hypothetical protein